MKRFFLLLILIPSTVFCQEKLRVDYTVTYNTSRQITKNATLYIYDTSYIYTEGKNEKRKVDAESVEGEVFVQYRGSKKYNITDLEKDSLFSKVNVRGNEYLLKERTPGLNWLLTNDEKILEGHKLKKAKLYFRGRNYIAWYSEKIPINAGPWKFAGLPGLIFEVYDSSQRYVWQLNKITKINDGHSIPIIPICPDCDHIDLKEYCFIRYDQEVDNSSILRNLPRGTTMTFTRPPRNGKEIKFDWEN